MAKKLFVAQIEYEIVVAAKDLSAAHQAAREALTDFSFDEEPNVMVRPVHRIKMPGGKNPWMLPEGYGETALPWGGEEDGDKTIGEYLKEQEANG